MARKYDSSRRTDAANRTREAILAAAFRLHGLGILDMESLAQEANVSLPTVRKHFPTREVLFEGCTDYGMHLVTMPDVEAIVSTSDPEARTRLAVIQVLHVHEELFGQLWESFKLEDESPTLAALIASSAELNALIAGLVIEPWQVEEDRVAETRGFVIGLLHPLTYRALRKFGGLSADQALEHTASAILTLLQSAGVPATKEAAHR